MRDHPVRPEFGDGNVGIAEIDADDRRAGGARGLDVGAANRRPSPRARGRRRRCGSSPISGLGSGLATPNVSWPQTKAKRSSDAELAEQQMRGMLRACWCRRRAASPPRRSGRGTASTPGKERGLVGDMRVVMGEKVGEQRLERRRRESRGPRARSRAAISARAARAEQRARRGDRHRRDRPRPPARN